MSDVSLSKAVRTNLLSLQNTATMMNKTQERLATGNKVNSALDNPSNFFTASSLNSRAADMGNLLDSMASGIKTIEAASNGITALTKNVESMQSTLRQARQDKSFQTSTFDVTKDSVLSVSGGQYGETTDIKLGTQAAGISATVSTAGTYTGATKATTEGFGARALVTLGTTALNDTIKIDGKTVTLTAAAQNAASLKTALDTTLGGAGEADKLYRISDVGGQIAIENKDTFGTAPKIEFGSTLVQATKGTTSFKFTPETVGTVTVGGQQIVNSGSFDDFVKNLESGAEAGKYTVAADATSKKITLTNTDYGTTAPDVVGVPAYTDKAVTKFGVPAANIAADSKFTIDGKEVSFGAAAGTSQGDNGAKLVAAINSDTVLNQKYVATFANNEVVLTAKVTGSGQTKPTVTSSDIAFGNVTFQDGDTGKTPVIGTAGVYATEQKGATDELNVNYGDKVAKIELRAPKAAAANGAPTADEMTKYREDTVKDVNAQLKSQGLDVLEASFDANGKLSFTSKETAAKTLAISGADAGTMFNGNTVSTGKEAVSGYNSKGTVDQFVEEINRSQAGKLRASNDNGKLRIENLSTQQLDVSFDSDGASGALSTVSSKIDGNAVRANLSKQFNELRDQLDKLSDDASFNGINLLRGDKLTITFNESGTSAIDIQSKDKDGNVRGISASDLGIESLNAVDLDSDAGIDAFLGKLSSALSDLRSQSSTFGSNLSSVQNRQDFTKSMINTLETGAANLTLADMNAEAANLLALQTRQSLSSSALSMASQADQGVLQLLR